MGNDSVICQDFVFVNLQSYIYVKISIGHFNLLFSGHLLMIGIYFTGVAFGL